MEILKIKLNETQTLIAYFGSKREDGSKREVGFKVGPDSGNTFIDCSPDAAMVLLAMLDKQAKQTP